MMFLLGVFLIHKMCTLLLFCNKVISRNDDINMIKKIKQQSIITFLRILLHLYTDSILLLSNDSCVILNLPHAIFA